MSRPARPKKGTASAARPKGASESRPVRLLQPATLFALTFMLAAVVAGPYLPGLLPDLSQQPEYQFSLVDLRVTPPNSWVPPGLISRLILQGELPEKVSLLDPEVARRVGEVLEKQPWIRRVDMVRVTGEPVLQAYLDYRRPVMFIESGSTPYPVDGDGVVLPLADFAPSDIARLPHLLNVQSKPPVEAGLPWEDMVVSEAARLADALCPGNDLTRHWNRFGIVGIIAPAPGDKPSDPRLLTFKLKLQGGSEIYWGPAPGSDSLEPSVNQKLAKLEAMYQQGIFKQLLETRQQQWFDIRLFGNELSYGPLEAGTLR